MSDQRPVDSPCPTRGSFVSPIIFLDFDGVIRVFDDSRQRVTSLSPEKTVILADILQRTSARVVVSSSRRSTVAAMRELFVRAERRDVALRVLDITPRLDRQSRGREIQAWLTAHPADGRRFCILDDDDDMDELLPHLVRTDPWNGLTAREAHQAIALLAGDSVTAKGRTVS